MATWILFPVMILNWKGTTMVTVPYLPHMSLYFPVSTCQLTPYSNIHTVHITDVF